MMTPFRTPSDEANAEFSPAPLLVAFENFDASFFDLERDIRISASQLKKLKTELRRKMNGVGLGSGDRIVAALPNGALFAAVWAAILEGGAPPRLVTAAT